MYSSTVSIDIADKVVENINKQFNSSLNKSNYTILNVEIIKENNLNVIYAYHLAPVGFVLISASNKADPVIGYSFESNLKLENYPSNFNYFLNKQKTYIYELINNESVATD